MSVSSWGSSSQARLPQVHPRSVGGRWLDFLRYTHVVLEVVVSCRGTWRFSRSRRFSCQVGCGVVLGFLDLPQVERCFPFRPARHVDCSCCDTGCPFPDIVGSDSGPVLLPYWHNEISVERKTLGNKSAHSHDFGWQAFRHGGFPQFGPHVGLFMTFTSGSPTGFIIGNIAPSSVSTLRTGHGHVGGPRHH